jgi:hypothetical protein
MKCDKCGRNYDGPGVPVIEFKKIVFGSMQPNPPARITICPECAESRRKLPGFIFAAICLAIVAALIACSLLK